MLTKEDLQAIGELVRSEVRASEERMTARISESEERTKTSIMAYIENDVKKEIRQIADGHKMLAEKMDRMETKIDRLQDQVDTIQGDSPRRKWLSPAGFVLNNS